jgi:hypothetical protein
MRRRDPGYTSEAELAAAMAPFNRPPAHTPLDLPQTFIAEASVAAASATIVWRSHIRRGQSC